MVTKIISGGQIGADIAGLRAAKKAGVKTGGWAPRTYRTLAGSNYELRDVYGLDEHSEPEYPPRTYLNVLESDGTVRFAYNFTSPGEFCTAKAVRKYNKPCFDVVMYQDHFGWEMIPDYTVFAVWLEDKSISVLNVAGNAGNHIELAIEEYLLEALEITNGNRESEGTI